MTTHDRHELTPAELALKQRADAALAAIGRGETADELDDATVREARDRHRRRVARRAALERPLDRGV